MPSKKALAKKLSAERRTSSRSSRSVRPKLTIFDLPLEVRDIIYTSLLTEKTAIKPKVHCSALEDIHLCRAHHHIHRSAVGLQPQILRVSRQLNEEASRVLYARNIFKFDDEHSCCPHPYDDMSLDLDMDEDEWRHTQEVHDFKLFLIDIGPENRMFLRKLEFNFAHRQVFGRGGYDRQSVKSGRFVGKSFADGFRILEAGHSLQSLQITLEGCGMPDELLSRDELLQSIRKVKNIPDFQIKADCGCVPTYIKYQLENINKMLCKASGKHTTQPGKNTTTADVWRNVTATKSVPDSLSNDQLMDKVRRLVSEQRTLRARIADDTERENFIEMVLAKTRASLS